MILDEATSRIDPYTDLLTSKPMDVLLKDRTSIIIAHRILVIDNGRIVEEGSHEELMRKEGLYHHLYEMQFKEPEEVTNEPAVSREATAKRTLEQKTL